MTMSYCCYIHRICHTWILSWKQFLHQLLLFAWSLPIHSLCLFISWLLILLWLVAVSASSNPVTFLGPTSLPLCITMYAQVCYVLVPLLTCYPSLIMGTCPLPFSSEAYNILWKNKRVQVRKITSSIKAGESLPVTFPLSFFKSSLTSHFFSL